MIDFGIGFVIGFMIGLVLKPKDKDIAEQKRIYEEKLKEYEMNINYYKNLCKWHAERKANEQTKSS